MSIYDEIQIADPIANHGSKNLPTSIQLLTTGMYESNPWFWSREIFKCSLLWLGMVYFCVCGNGNNWSYLLSGILAAQLWHQAAFIAHDGRTLL